MTLYVSNTTRQTIVMQVRWYGDHNGRPFVRMIPSGQQIAIKADDLGPDYKNRFNVIIQHLENRMGGRPMSEVQSKSADGMEDFKGITWKMDEAVPVDTITSGFDIVKTNAQKRSADEAQKAAKGFDIAINGKGPRRAKVNAVEIIQDADPYSGPQDDAIRFSMTIAPPSV